MINSTEKSDILVLIATFVMPDLSYLISLSKVMEVPTDTSATKRYVVAIAGSKTNFSTADRER